MVCVFLAFALSGERGVSQMGLGLAVAIFIDAFIVRSLLVPALMHTLGDWNWWLPGWLDRLLPQLRVEGPDKAWDDNLVDV
jgi:RND superfamily putative drug exporter